MKPVLMLWLLAAPFLCGAQGYINKSKKKVKDGLEQYIRNNKQVEAKLLETDTTLVLTIPGTTSQAAEFIYRFDKKNKCISEKTIASCDSCFQKYVASALSKKQYDWVKINENQYVSSFNYRLLLELPGRENVYSYMILRTSWTREMYRMILNRK